MKTLILLAISILLPNLAVAQESLCFDCHSDEELTMEVGKKSISLFVDSERFNNSVHGDMDCEDCHEDFDVDELPHKEGNNIADVNCGNCHEDHAMQVKNDIHHRLKSIVGDKSPECIDCHDYHYVKSPSKVRNKTSEYCSQCHSNLNFKDQYHAFSGVKDNVCGECHEAEEFRGELLGSMHKELSCTDCHRYTAKNFSLHQDGVPNLQIADCSTCHSEEGKEHSESIHGLSLIQGINEAAHCWDCHGGHNVLSANDPLSKVYPMNLPKTCADCHSDTELLKELMITAFKPTETYTHSVHGRKFYGGDENAPNCTSCHGVHNIKSRIQSGSTINEMNIPTMCGQCHTKEMEEYQASIHWLYIKKGVKYSPNCNDCHSEHGQREISGNGNRIEAMRTQEETCMVCHENELLARRFGLSGNEPKLYQDSYHGLAVMRGDENAAMCIDCHNVHKILPRSHLESSVSDGNVVATCQKCHPDANEQFSKSYSHRSISEESLFVENLVRNLYFWLIVLVIGGMFLHNLLIYIYELRKNYRSRRDVVHIPRFTKNEVVQHLFLLTSFITLAITGFALKFPNSFWANGLMEMGLTEDLRQLIHRIAAVIMILTGVYHVLYLLFTHRGRFILKNLLPNWRDIQHAIQNIKYHLRLTDKYPEFDLYDYTEKAEYWALIWGTLIMGVTGFFLWFPTIIGPWAPVWLIKVSEIVHYYEAILASLAIIIWHWFFVIFRPSEYPMSFVWVDGQISLKNFRHHHEKKFKEVLLEWYKFKNGMIDRKDFSYFTLLMFDAFEKNNIDPDSVFLQELERDSKLKKWLENQFSE